MNVVFGAGGVARELFWLISEGTTDATLGEILPDAFCVPDEHASEISALDGIPVIGESRLPEFSGRTFKAYIAIGEPRSKCKVAAWLEANFDCLFPSFVHSTVPMDRRVGKTTIGRGAIVYPGATITTGVEIGDFVHLNPCATIGHEAKIGTGSTICPGANLSGGVFVGRECFVGAGAVIREGLQIADNCVIGAGAVVTRSILKPGTWAGVPARQIG